jgi:hypothetical protein
MLSPGAIWNSILFSSSAFSCLSMAKTSPV